MELNNMVSERLIYTFLWVQLHSTHFDLQVFDSSEGQFFRKCIHCDGNLKQRIGRKLLIPLVFFAMLRSSSVACKSTRRKSHTQLLSQNNPLYRLIDQITSRWSTPPHFVYPSLPRSSHLPLPLTLRNRAFLFVQFHPPRPSFLPSISPHLPHSRPLNDTGVAKSWERHFLFHLRRGTAAWRFINNKLRRFLRGLEREEANPRLRGVGVEGAAGGRRARLLGGINLRTNIGGKVKLHESKYSMD